MKSFSCPTMFLNIFAIWAPKSILIFILVQSPSLVTQAIYLKETVHSFYRALLNLLICSSFWRHVFVNQQRCFLPIQVIAEMLQVTSWLSAWDPGANADAAMADPEFMASDAASGSVGIDVDRVETKGSGCSPEIFTKEMKRKIPSQPQKKKTVIFRGASTPFFWQQQQQLFGGSESPLKMGFPKRKGSSFQLLTFGGQLFVSGRVDLRRFWSFNFETRSMSPASLVYFSSHNHGSLKKVRWDRSLTLVGLRATRQLSPLTARFFNPFKEQTPPKLPPRISDESTSTLINESTELRPPQKKKKDTQHISTNLNQPHSSPSQKKAHCDQVCSMLTKRMRCF